MSNWYDYTVSSEYGMRVHPITNEYKNHNGIDYAVPLNTNINSNVNGTVIKSEYNSGFGNYVVIKDNDNFYHYYAHLNSSNVNVGDKISVNDSIGLSGSTGLSTGAHLHYEVRNTENQSVNPSKYITGESNDIPSLRDALENKTVSNYDGNVIDLAKEKYKGLIFNAFKYLIIILVFILSVILIINSLDIEL